MRRWSSREVGVDKESSVDGKNYGSPPTSPDKQMPTSSSGTTPTSTLTNNDNKIELTGMQEDLLAALFSKKSPADETNGSRKSLDDEIVQYEPLKPKTESLKIGPTAPNAKNPARSLSLSIPNEARGSLFSPDMSKKKMKKNRKWITTTTPIQFSRNNQNYSPIPGKAPTTMDGHHLTKPIIALPTGTSIPLSESNGGKKKDRSWVSTFLRSRQKPLLDDKKHIDEANEEEIIVNETLEHQNKLRAFARSNKVVWKRFAVTCCPALLARNGILERKLALHGKKVTVDSLDMYARFSKNSSGFSPLSSDGSPNLISPGTDPIDLNENDYQEFEGQKQDFDVFDLQQLVLVLQNSFSCLNIAIDNGLCIGFICPEDIDNKNCTFNCDRSFRSIKKSLGNWRCKAFTEVSANSVKLIQRKPTMNTIPFIYETWWFPDFVEAFKLEKDPMCGMNQIDQPVLEKRWLDGNDTILVCPLDKVKMERRISSTSINIRTNCGAFQINNNSSINRMIAAAGGEVSTKATKRHSTPNLGS